MRTVTCLAIVSLAIYSIRSGTTGKVLQVQRDSMLGRCLVMLETAGCRDVRTTVPMFAAEKVMMHW